MAMQPHKANQTKLALALLAAMPEVQSATLLPEDETARLIATVDQRRQSRQINCPLPALIDVQIKSDSVIASSVLQKRLLASISEVQIDDHADWLQQLHHIVRALTALGWLLVALTGTALVNRHQPDLPRSYGGRAKNARTPAHHGRIGSGDRRNLRQARL